MGSLFRTGLLLTALLLSCASRSDAGAGTFRVRGEGMEVASKSAFIPIYAFDVVSGQAVINLRRILEGMLAKSPSAVRKALKKYNATFAIIGKNQEMTDLPPYAFLKGVYTFDGRPYSSLRGVGAPNTRFTVTSAAEENLLFLASDPYIPWEILSIHEFGHTVLNVGLADQPSVTAAELKAFKAALKREAASMTPSRPYGFVDKDEYWAVFTEAWFESIIRTDVNLGIITRYQLKARDKSLSSIYKTSAYGDGIWTYSTDPNLPHDPVYESQAAVSRRARPRPPPHRSHIGDMRKKVARLNAQNIWRPGGDS